jgi:hypothetical protein
MYTYYMYYMFTYYMHVPFYSSARGDLFWLVGLWWGDSQAGLLAIWLGHAIAQMSWADGGEKHESSGGAAGSSTASDGAAGDGVLAEGAAGGSAVPLPLDYYLYSTFTENPANQCFLLPRDRCVACMERCKENPLPASAYCEASGKRTKAAPNTHHPLPTTHHPPPTTHHPPPTTHHPTHHPPPPAPAPPTTTRTSTSTSTGWWVVGWVVVVGGGWRLGG